MEELNWLMQNLSIITAVITVASVLANFTKTEVDNKILNVIGKIVNVLALNIKNK